MFSAEDVLTTLISIFFISSHASLSWLCFGDPFGGPFGLKDYSGSAQTACRLVGRDAVFCWKGHWKIPIFSLEGAGIKPRHH